MKTNMLIALSFASVVIPSMLSSCKKDDDKNGGGPNLPGFDLTGVAPSDFKNTAFGTAPVAAVFNNVANSVQSVDMSGTRGSVNRPAGLTQGDVLNTDRVNSFLASSDDSSMHGTQFGGLSIPSEDEVKEGGDCSDMREQVDSVFQGAASALRETANALEQFKGNLPDGITRGGPTEQFAVTYTFDLAKLKISTDDSGSTEHSGSSFPSDSRPVPTIPSEDHSGQGLGGNHYFVSLPSIPSRPDSNHGSDDSGHHGDDSGAMTTSGLAMVGVGANADMAVFALSVDASGADKLQSGSVRAQFSASANQKDKVLKVSVNGNENITSKSDSTSQTANIHGTQSAGLTLQAGDKPYIDLAVSGSVNGTPVEGGTLSLTNEDHTIAANVKVESADNKGITVTYSYTVDAKKADGKLVMETNEMGQCVVKESTSSAPSSLAAR